MSTGQYILEVFGVVAVGFGAFLLTRIFALAPLQRDLTKMESTCHFCFIPVLVYSSFRLYFGVLFHFTKNLSKTRPVVGKFGAWKRFVPVGTVLTASLLVAIRFLYGFLLTGRYLSHFFVRLFA